jgi:Tfp pilus assembly protein PilX
MNMHTPVYRYNRTPHGQSGSALLIGLIILVVITLIGVSGVRGVIMEKNMASNNQYKVLVFQAAETGIEGALADGSAFVAAINTPVSGTWPTRNYNVTHADNKFAVTSTAQIQVGTPTVPVGYSIGEFVSYPFTITSDGAIASINAADRHIQKATKIAPYLN